MYSTRTRRRARALADAGHSQLEISRLLRVHRATLRAWAASPLVQGDCPWCDDAELDEEAYAALLGYYLGDGCISRAARYSSLRVSCDDKWPGIIDDVTALLRRVRPLGRVHHVSAPGCTVVQGNWVHWPCLFPQHGPGRKHERPIVLDDWQRDLVSRHPGPFLRGLFHSDGTRVDNMARQIVAGVPKVCRYPRWQFCNVSPDIRELCCWTLDLVGVAWRQSNWKTISVSRREAVDRLDALIGLKS